MDVMRRPTLFLLAIAAPLCLATPAPAQGVPALREGMPYAQARSLILAGGWKPVAQAAAPANAIEAQQRAAGRVELEACAGTGEGPCRFAFAGRDRRLIVVTVNNDTTLPTVLRWFLE